MIPATITLGDGYTITNIRYAMFNPRDGSVDISFEDVSEKSFLSVLDRFRNVENVKRIVHHMPEIFDKEIETGGNIASYRYNFLEKLAFITII